MKRVFCAAFLGLVCANASVSFADDGPSYEETVRFIKEKIDKRPDFSTSDTAENGDLIVNSVTDGRLDLKEISKCEFSYLRSTQTKSVSYYRKKIHSKDSWSSDSLYRFTMKAFDPKRIDLGSNPFRKYVVLRTTNDSMSISYTEAGKKIGGVTSLEIDYEGERAGDQLRKAFSHLIELCGGKSELF